VKTSVDGDSFRIDAAASVRWVSLTVSDLSRSLDFYQRVMGFVELDRVDGDGVVLGCMDMTPVIVLYEQKNARPKPFNTRGLYHYAVLLPSRKALAQAFTRLANLWDFEGFADHLVSEALYLQDPDGHGIEVYADRPRERWSLDTFGQLRMATLPLNIDSLLEELRGEGTRNSLAEGWKLPDGARLGHIHLHVSTLQKAEQFYHKLMGFDVTLRGYPGALFMSAGGYHHHIGVNTWAGVEAPPPPSESVQLKSFSIELPTQASLNQLVERLRNKGCVVEEGLVNPVKGYMGYVVRDFDGNKVELITRKL